MKLPRRQRTSLVRAAALRLYIAAPFRRPARCGVVWTRTAGFGFQVERTHA